MSNKTNFFIKVVTSIYDIKAFSKYAKEGISGSISYAMLLALIMAGIKGIFLENGTDNFELNAFINLIIINFKVIFISLLINCLIAGIFALIFSIFIRMVVKYMALYSLTLYAATLPLIMQTALEIINPNVSFDAMFIVGTLTYVILILKYIKDEIIKNINSEKN